MHFLPTVANGSDGALLVGALGFGVVLALGLLVFPFVLARRLGRLQVEAAQQSQLLRDIAQSCARTGKIGESILDIRALLTHSPKLVLEYAKRQYASVPFREGEPLIASDPQAALEYAEAVLGRPFPEGEAAIARDGKLACRYALRVLHSRFPQGEPAINADPDAKWEYAEAVLKFEAGATKPPARRTEPLRLSPT